LHIKIKSAEKWPTRGASFYIGLLAQLAKGQLSLWDGAASVGHPSTFSFKLLLLQNH